MPATQLHDEQDRLRVPGRRGESSHTTVEPNVNGWFPGSDVTPGDGASDAWGGGGTIVRRPKSQPWWRNKVFWGILISILLGGLSMVIEGAEADLKLAALLTLVGLALTIAIELRFRVDESAASLAKLDQHLDRFVDYVSAPESAREFFSEISADWHQIETRSSVFLGWLRQDAEREFRVRLHELAALEARIELSGRARS